MYPVSVTITIDGKEAFKGLTWCGHAHNDENIEEKILRVLDQVRYEPVKQSPYQGHGIDLNMKGNISIVVDDFPTISFNSLRMLHRPESREFSKIAYQDWIMDPSDEAKLIASLEPIVQRIVQKNEQRRAMHDAYERISPIGIPIAICAASLLILSVLAFYLLSRLRTQSQSDLA